MHGAYFFANTIVRVGLYRRLKHTLVFTDNGVARGGSRQHTGSLSALLTVCKWNPPVISSLLPLRVSDAKFLCSLELA